MARTESSVSIAPERPGVEAAIADVTAEAFRNHPYSHGQEPAVVAMLRREGALSVSLVARDADGAIVGHVAASAVAIEGCEATGWYGLGPLSVAPALQRRGVGSRLMCAVLDELRQRGARGCVLVGEPEYYRRFGFRADAALPVPGVPLQYCLSLRLAPNADSGAVKFHAAFSL